MTSREPISSNGTRFLAPIIAGLGALMIIRTVGAGGGPLSAGVLLGAIFLALGAGRLYLSIRARS
jgi:multisubunit Na+/H+ antiporter MnhB subunit